MESEIAAWAPMVPAMEGGRADEALAIGWNGGAPERVRPRPARECRSRTLRRNGGGKGGSGSLPHDGRGRWKFRNPWLESCRPVQDPRATYRRDLSRAHRFPAIGNPFGAKAAPEDPARSNGESFSSIMGSLTPLSPLIRHRFKLERIDRRFPRRAWRASVSSPSGSCEPHRSRE